MMGLDAWEDGSAGMCSARDRTIAELLVGMVINFFIYLITVAPPPPAAMVPPTRPSIEFHIVPAWESLAGGKEGRREEKRKGKSGSSELGPIKIIKKDAQIRLS